MPKNVATTGTTYVTDAAVVAPAAFTIFQNHTYANDVPVTPSAKIAHSETESSASAPGAGEGAASANGASMSAETVICMQDSAVGESWTRLSMTRDSVEPMP
ncbi:hypothetical protein GCM10025876_15660 [Demequina litorisediminis]|uniref:Uncharacterized protein n=1 Tax=Demequina litorisediminis TaxID=1849022 RepID=A0ABQ6IF44_9MICO|nr:hypothetical protein GCM10025876_15660 [Demequina litorisediminis]